MQQKMIRIIEVVFNEGILNNFMALTLCYVWFHLGPGENGDNDELIIRMDSAQANCTGTDQRYVSPGFQSSVAVMTFINCVVSPLWGFLSVVLSNNILLRLRQSGDSMVQVPCLTLCHTVSVFRCLSPCLSPAVSHCFIKQYSSLWLFYSSCLLTLPLFSLFSQLSGFNILVPACRMLFFSFLRGRACTWELGSEFPLLPESSLSCSTRLCFGAKLPN